jgi:malonyl-CoA decarboxylase
MQFCVECNTDDVKSLYVNSYLYRSVGLSGVDLGNFLIKHVVRELQHEFPNITQYATLSPIPGFRHWLLLHVNESIENEG